jgi:hypothetical protein
MQRKNRRSSQPASGRTRRAIAPPDVPVRSLDPKRPDHATDALQPAKSDAQGDMVDDDIRRMIEAAYT